MQPRELIIDDAVLAHTGKAGARAIARALHAQGDCQTCVKPLRAGSITLCADVPRGDQAPAIASLHHTDCRASDWNDSGVVSYTSKSVTYMVTYWLVEDNMLGTMPVMALNPAMEQVAIRPLDGGWYPSAQRQYLKAGLQAVPRPGHAPRTPAITARASGQGLLAATVPSGDTYPAPGDGCAVPGPVLALARQQRSIVLAVTQADSSQVHDGEALLELLGDPLTVMGRIAVSG